MRDSYQHTGNLLGLSVQFSIISFPKFALCRKNTSRNWRGVPPWSWICINSAHYPIVHSKNCSVLEGMSTSVFYIIEILRWLHFWDPQMVTLLRSSDSYSIEILRGLPTLLRSYWDSQRVILLNPQMFTLMRSSRWLHYWDPRMVTLLKSSDGYIIEILRWLHYWDPQRVTLLRSSEGYIIEILRGLHYWDPQRVTLLRSSDGYIIEILGWLRYWNPQRVTLLRSSEGYIIEIFRGLHWDT